MEQRSPNIFRKYRTSFAAILGSIIGIITIVSMVSDYDDFAGLPLFVWVSILLASILLAGGWPFFSETEHLKSEISVLNEKVADLQSAISSLKTEDRAPLRDPNVEEREAHLERQRNVIRQFGNPAKDILFTFKNANMRSFMDDDTFDKTAVAELVQHGIFERKESSNGDYFKITIDYWELFRSEGWALLYEGFFKPTENRRNYHK